MYPALVLSQRGRRNPVVEFVSVGETFLENLLESVEGLVYPRGCQTETDGLAATGGQIEGIVRGGLGPGLGGVDRLAAARDDVLVEGVLGVGRRVGLAPETAGIALVLGEEQLRGAIAVEPVLAELMVRGSHDAGSHFAQQRLRLVCVPGPGVAEPERRQNTNAGRFRPAIVHGHPNEDVLRPLLRVLHEHVKIPVVGEHARIEQFVFELFPRSPSVGLDQVPVGIFPLRVLVEILHVRVGRRAVDVEVRTP